MPSKSGAQWLVVSGSTYLLRNIGEPKARCMWTRERAKAGRFGIDYAKSMAAMHWGGDVVRADSAGPA